MKRRTEDVIVRAANYAIVVLSLAILAALVLEAWLR